MSKLAEKVRESYEREQAALGDVGDARHRLIQSALTAPARETHRLQWAAAVAAVLTGAIVITTFALVRGSTRPHAVPAASPKVSASPTPLQNQLSVPQGTPVILYHDPADFDQLDGVTWDGKKSGTVGAGVSTGGNASPDGSKYTTLADKSLFFIFWADDSIHYCDVVRTATNDVTGPGMLQFGARGQALRNVARVGTIGASGLNAGGPVVIACSPSADRAVVYQAGGQGIGVTEFWVIQLSTGRTLWHGGSGGPISASHDGRYIALTGQSGSTTVYGPTGEDLAHLGDAVYAFSWDDKLAVTAASFTAQPSVIDWLTGQTIWTCPNSSFKYWQAFAEPDGSHIAIGALDPKYPQTGGFAPVDLFVVGADGVTVFERDDITLFSQ